MKIENKLLISYEEDRNNTIIALVNNGYSVRMEKEEDSVCNITYIIYYK